MSTCLEVLEPQCHPHIPPQSMSSGCGRTQNAPEREQRAPRPKSWTCSGRGKGQAGGTTRVCKWKDKGTWEGQESLEQESECKHGRERALLKCSWGCLSQPVLASIYSNEGGSFKDNLTEDFRMGCNCPANLNCAFQSHWECHRNADNIKLAMLSVTKDMYMFKNLGEKYY